MRKPLRHVAGWEVGSFAENQSDAPCPRPWRFS